MQGVHNRFTLLYAIKGAQRMVVKSGVIRHTKQVPFAD